MDDDILCEPESVLRMNAFANMTSAADDRRRADAVAEQPADAARERRTGGARRDQGRQAHPGARMGIDLIKKKQGRVSTPVGTAGGRYLLPAEIIADCGLPIPLFFQWDDIEYGIRARFAGHPTVTLPNAGVWHADFYLRDYDDWARYFSIRNLERSSRRSTVGSMRTTSPSTCSARSAN